MEVKSIKIEIEGKEFDISLEEAKKLYYVLNDMFGVKTWNYPIYPTYPSNPTFWWSGSSDNTK